MRLQRLFFFVMIAAIAVVLASIIVINSPPSLEPIKVVCSEWEERPQIQVGVGEIGRSRFCSKYERVN